MHVINCPLDTKLQCGASYKYSQWVVVAEQKTRPLSAISCREQITFRWEFYDDDDDDDDVRFILDQHIQLEFV